MNTLKMITATSLGIAAGAVLGILTAPRSGKKTRKMISNEVNDQMNKLEYEASRQLDDLKRTYNNSLKEYAKNGKELLEKTKETVSLN